MAATMIKLSRICYRPDSAVCKCHTTDRPVRALLLYFGPRTSEVVLEASTTAYSPTVALCRQIRTMDVEDLFSPRVAVLGINVTTQIRDAEARRIMRSFFGPSLYDNVQTWAVPCIENGRKC